MRKVPFLPLMIAASLVIVACAGESALARLDRLEPVPSLTPAEVVEIQLEALRNNDGENRGIEIAFRFASPRNRVSTGPLSRFIQLFSSAQYSPMLEAVEITYPEVRISDRVAFQPVVLTDAGGELHRYLFILIRQEEEPYRECWMVESVGPVDGGDAPVPERQPGTKGGLLSA